MIRLKRIYPIGRTAIIFVLCMMMVLIPTNKSDGHKLNLETDKPRTAKVIEVIDGEVIRVLYYYSDFKLPEVKIIKMIGINTYGKQEAYEHTLTSLLGQVVFILGEENNNFPSVSTLNASYAYVYSTMGRSMNEELLMNGYAMVDPAFKDAKYYDDLLVAEELAKQSEVGFFMETGDLIPAMFNINTASFDTMQQYLVDTTDEAIQKIIDYRTYNMFESVGEVKYADTSLNHEWFLANQGIYSAITNLNNANTYELASLFTGAADPGRLAEAIEQYKVFNVIDDISSLKQIAEVTNYYYSIEPFIDTKSEKQYTNSLIKVANVNTCTTSDLIAATGLSEWYGTQLKSERSYNDYYYKNVGETLVQGAPLYTSNAYRYSDNLTAFTDINTANRFELNTLFGLFNELSSSAKDELVSDIIALRPYDSVAELKLAIDSKYYNGIQGYVYVTSNDLPKSLNVNLADSAVLDSCLGMSALDMTSYGTYTKNYDYVNPNDINFNISGKGSKIALYTDINTASYYELLNLNRNMSADIVGAIIEFREDERITSLDEVLYIFTKYNRSYLYLELQDFIVFN
ncbi:MAG: thermonuclease family protein [Vallitaleaceae bacterium]|jgi:DNA uptake protein ComE-like DNA-binding protein|nr:thermonuclease family protein [Vallitaleaceae bacterium]